jgi:phosphatidylglycerophosphatase A
MGKRFDKIDEKLRAFIEDQKLFFVGTAAHEGRINVSPKGMDTLRVLDSNTVCWLNLTGSGNETAAHIQENSIMTLMFCAFEGSPMILRLYGQAEEIGKNHIRWDELIGHFPQIPGSRQLFLLNVDLVQTSCGFGVPFFKYEGPRDTLIKWADKKGSEGLDAYREEKNTVSLDGKEIRLG